MIANTMPLPANKQMVCWIAIMVVMFLSAGTKAGVGLPPMPDPSDTNAMNMYQSKVNYDAQKSEQERLRVAQERYDMMLGNRSNILQVMTAQLESRKKQVFITSEPAGQAFRNKVQPAGWSGIIIGIVIVGLCFSGFRYYLYRQNQG